MTSVTSLRLDRKSLFDSNRKIDGNRRMSKEFVEENVFYTRVAIRRESTMNIDEMCIDKNHRSYEIIGHVDFLCLQIFLHCC
jgi:hypothetical protein